MFVVMPDPHRPRLTRDQSKKTLAEMIEAVIRGQQKTMNGQAPTGQGYIVAQDILEVLAGVAARTVNTATDPDRRLALAAGFDTKFMDENFRLEQLRLISPK